jgi:hypothetical protein
VDLRVFDQRQLTCLINPQVRRTAVNLRVYAVQWPVGPDLGVKGSAKWGRAFPRRFAGDLIQALEGDAGGEAVCGGLGESVGRWQPLTAQLVEVDEPDAW